MSLTVEERTRAPSSATTMKAAVVHELGGPLSVEDVPKPTPGPEEVVVRVIHSQRAPALERRGDEARDREGQRDEVVGGREGALDVAARLRPPHHGFALSRR